MGTAIGPQVSSSGAREPLRKERLFTYSGVMIDFRSATTQGTLPCGEQ